MNNNLHLCGDHKQEWKQSEYSVANCDYCKALARIKELEAENEQMEALAEKYRLEMIKYGSGWEIAEQRIVELEAENRQLSEDLYGRFFLEQVRKAKQQTAMDCIDEMEGYPTTVSVHVTSHDAKVATQTKNELVKAIKAHFGIKGE